MDPRLSPLLQRALAFPLPGGWQPPVRADTIRLSAGYPFAGAVPVAEIAAACARVLGAEGDRPLQYLGSAAMEDLGVRLAARAARQGLLAADPAEACVWANAPGRRRSVAPDALLLTAGASQALDLCAAALLGPSDAAVVESPTYMEALEILRNHAAELIPVPVDADGLQVDRLEEALRTRRRTGLRPPRLVYTIPRFQNPTGAVLSAARGQRLLELAEEFDLVVVADDAYGDLAFPGWLQPPRLRAVTPVGPQRVLHLGSLSKLVAPGLRIGWAAGPRWLIQAMAVVKKDLDHPFAQAVAGSFLAADDLEARIAWLRARYAERAAALCDALARHMPAGVRWGAPRGGFFVWVELPGGIDAAALLREAIDAGVAYVPGVHFDPGAGGLPTDRGGSLSRLRLSFSLEEPDKLRRGALILGQVLAKALAAG